MENIFNSPCKNLYGNISLGELFRPVNSNKVIKDNYGYEWKQETAAGWRRIVDNFFIPMGPNGDYYQHQFHSVENQRLLRKHREKETKGSK